MTDRTVTDLCELAKDEGAQRAETDRGSGQEIWPVTGPSTVDSEVPTDMHMVGAVHPLPPM